MTNTFKNNLNDLQRRIDKDAEEVLLIFGNDRELYRYKQEHKNIGKEYILITQEELNYVGALRGMRFSIYNFV